MKPVKESTRHGSADDTRYPSSRKLRRFCAFVVDWTIHISCGIGAAVLVSPAFSLDAVTRLDWKHTGVNVLALAGFWSVASVTDRVVVQAIFHTTVGKAVFGLCVITPEDGSFPSFGRLLKVWFVDLYMAIALPIALLFCADGPGPDNIDDYLLPAVRRRDVRRGPIGR
ncbi:RDD family protein [Nocardia sp. 004]|uniref:RDD family protein n=1 Tax=Nocardia sp. 004 TaxID=3385978 RepID=UPI00399F2866